MQDRFKFRGIHPVLGELQEIKFIDFIHNTVDFGDGDIFNIEDVKIQQSTGLKDKNGKLIFEGDIVKFRNIDNKYYIGTIKYTDEDALFCLSYKNENNRDDWDYVSKYRLEVIGNRYENPELLGANQ